MFRYNIFAPLLKIKTNIQQIRHTHQKQTETVLLKQGWIGLKSKSRLMFENRICLEVYKHQKKFSIPCNVCERFRTAIILCRLTMTNIQHTEFQINSLCQNPAKSVNFEMYSLKFRLSHFTIYPWWQLLFSNLKRDFFARRDSVSQKRFSKKVTQFLKNT